MDRERYGEAVDYLQRRLWHELPIVPVERALQHRIRQLLSHFGDPHVRFPVIHVAGSAGKGSTAAIVASILQAAGLRTGLYTSPHLQTFIERIDVNGRLISPEQFADDVLGLEPLVRKMHIDVLDGAGYGRPSLVEVAFAVGMKHFADEHVDVAVIEAGLGGRTDYTNVFEEKKAMVITNVALEHRERLGWSLPSIAREKAALIRGGAPVVTSAAGEPLRIIAARAAEAGAPVLRLGREIRARVEAADADGSDCSFSTPGLSIERARLALAGEHQVRNAALAVAAVEAFADGGGGAVGDEAIRRGLGAVRISGRLEQVQATPRVLLDSAHNPVEARSLVRALTSHWLRDGVRLHLVAGILADKDQLAMVRAFASVASTVVLTQPPLGERIGDPTRMLALCRRTLGDERVAFEHSHEAALDLALDRASADDIVCVTGSMFLVGALRGRWVPERRILDCGSAVLESAEAKGWSRGLL